MPLTLTLNAYTKTLIANRQNKRRQAALEGFKEKLRANSSDTAIHTPLTAASACIAYTYLHLPTQTPVLLVCHPGRQKPQILFLLLAFDGAVGCNGHSSPVCRTLVPFGGRLLDRGGLGGRGLGEVFPFAPAVEVDEGLHAAPFHDLAFEPDEVDGLIWVVESANLPWETRVRGWTYLCQEIIAPRCQRLVPIALQATRREGYDNDWALEESRVHEFVLAVWCSNFLISSFRDSFDAIRKGRCVGCTVAEDPNLVESFESSNLFCSIQSVHHR